MNGEILRLVDTIHRDKDIDKEIIFQGVEACILSAVRKKLGETTEETGISVVINRENGETTVYDGEDAVPISDLGRLAALQGKQVLFQKIREAERDKIFDEYEQKLGKLVTGIVQRSEGPSLIVNLGSGKVEGILPRSEQAPGERFRVGERIKVLVLDVRKNHKVKIVLSRSSPEFVRALFELEVPEISEKVIEIKEIVREPGYRTKIAVTTYDPNVDCVGACVGVRGSRIKNIVDELFGEKIDIVRWNESIEVLIMNALKPAEIISMDLFDDEQRAKVYVRPDQQSLAIGKRGQNVRLASKLAKWELDIVTVSEEDIEKLRKGETPGQDNDEATDEASTDAEATDEASTDAEATDEANTDTEATDEASTDADETKGDDAGIALAAVNANAALAEAAASGVSESSVVDEGAIHGTSKDEGSDGNDDMTGSNAEIPAAAEDPVGDQPDGSVKASSGALVSAEEDPSNPAEVEDTETEESMTAADDDKPAS